MAEKVQSVDSSAFHSFPKRNLTPEQEEELLRIAAAKKDNWDLMVTDSINRYPVVMAYFAGKE